MDHNVLDHKKLEAKWKAEWSKVKVYLPDIKTAKNPFYNLMMFPYPSAEGLHVGNMYAFSGTDVYGRFKRMQGYDVFEPIGLDGFGIHSENYAIKVGRHPKEHAKISEKNFYKQLESIGNAFAWENRLETYDSEYYKWTQWLFIKMFETGLAYKEAAIVNWCPNCKTVLSDEQVEAGECERCGSEVERKEMSSWFFKITDYADRLLDNLEKIDWPAKIKTAQQQWIGRKTGANITYKIADTEKSVTCFTTRPDTNFGATFVVTAPEYLKENLTEIIPEKFAEKVSEYIETALNKSEQERKIEEKQKTGVFTGLYAVNPLTEQKMPIYVADYVLMGFGTGAVVGVPAHDERDFDFAKKHNLEIKKVIESEEEVFTGYGKVINSDFLNDLNSQEAIDKISDYLEENNIGERTTTYHLRDWGISRQRYWGPPIPMINCSKCGWVPEKEENLPIVLPDIDDFKPKGDGTSPLSNAPDGWKNVKCPECGGNAQRELDVSDTFLDSSWYFLRYPFVNLTISDSSTLPWDMELVKKWFPVNAYIGGAEHAVLHLLYSRFIWQVLIDQNLLPSELEDEPFPFLFSHGLIIKDGAKMSKSKGNVINPDEYIEKYGADALRLYLMFLGPFEGGGDFRDSGMEGMKRFVNKVWKLVHETKDKQINQQDSKKLLNKLHKTVQKATKDIERFQYNTAISAVMELINLMGEIENDSNGKSDVWNESLETIVQLLAPLAPFVTEELWVNTLENEFSVHKSKWPEYDENLTIDEVVKIAVQINGKLRATLEVDLEEANDEAAIVEQALADNNVRKHLEGKEIDKKIFVPGRILNLVV